MLVLLVKKKQFDRIADGTVKEDYRELSAYYKSRFSELFCMKPNSYIPTGEDQRKLWLRIENSESSPTLEVICSLSIGAGIPEWGAKPGRQYYILHIIQAKRIH
jgi:hypothetical protein